MRYNIVKDADEILKNSKYLIKNPSNYKNKWKTVFNNNNPICLELGMGRGSFITNMAILNPKVNYAKDIINFFGKEIDTIYLTFSEPWPKKQDANKRFTNISYLKLYDRIFKKNKHIILKTDNKILFASALESLSDYWYVFDKVSLDLHNDERKIDNVMTDFEKQYYKEHRAIYYVDASFKG